MLELSVVRQEQNLSNMKMIMPCLDKYDCDNPLTLCILIGELIIDFTLVAALISLNVFIVISIVRHWRSCMSSVLAETSCRLVLNLAASDILVGLSSVYYLVFYYFCNAQYLDQRRMSCFMKLGTVILGHIASWYSLVAIAVDRYIAVVHALRYSTLINTRRVGGIIILIWMIAALNTLLVIIMSPWTPGEPCDEGHVFSVLLYCILTAINVIFVFSMLAVTHWRVHREAAALNVSTPRKVCTWSRSGFTLLLAAGCFVISFVPIITVIFLRVVASEIFSTQENAKLITGLTFTVSKANFIVNPFLYSWKNSTIRSAMISQFKCCAPCWVSTSKEPGRIVSEITKCSSMVSVTSDVGNTESVNA